MPIAMLIVLVNVLALLALTDFRDFSMQPGATFAVLSAMSLAYSLVTWRSERLRPALAENRCPNMVGVWTAAAMFLLPAPWLAAFCAVTYLAEWPARRSSYVRTAGCALHQRGAIKYLYSASACVVACVASAGISGPFGAVAQVPVAVVAFMIINAALVIAAMVAAGERQALPMFRQPRAHLRELGTQAVGAAAAAGMQSHLVLGLLALPCVLAIQRLALREGVVAPGAIDPETAAWSERVWCILAAHELSTRHPAIVMIIEPAPGVARTAAMPVLRHELRDTDLVGCLGSSGLVVLATRTPAVAAPFITQRLRVALADAGVSCSIGEADSAGHADLSELLVVASGHVVTDRAGVQLR